MTPPRMAACAGVLFILACALMPGATGANDCLAKGFDAPLCSTCKLLAQYVPASNGVDLGADCRACCTPDGDGGGAANPSAPLAARAVLEVCDSHLRRHAHVQGFLDKEAKAHPALRGRVTHVPRWGMPPRLLLLDGGGGLIESTRIDNWKTEHITEYLTERLEKRGGGGGGSAASA